MKRSLPASLLLLALISCNPDNSEVVAESEQIDFMLTIDPAVVFSVEELASGRVESEEQIYFFLGVYEYDGTSETSNPYTNNLLYASGGYSHLPTELPLSVFSNREYIIQALALKQANGFGIATTTYEHSNQVYPRLHLGYDLNPNLPAILCDSINYSDPWLTTNSGVLLFFDGYMYADSDSSSTVYRGPMAMNAYYQSLVIETGTEPSEITLEPERKVFGIEVNVDGLDADNYIEFQLGYTMSEPFKVTTENNGELFIFPPSSYESETATFNLTVKKVIIDDSGNHITETIFQESNQSFPLLKKTILDITIDRSSSRNENATIELKEVELSEGQTISISG